MASSSSVNAFTWTDKEIKCNDTHDAQAKDWESIKNKYDNIMEIMHKFYTKEPDEDFPRSKNLHDLNRAGITSKLKNIRASYMKAVDAGRRCGGGRVVMTFYDLCNDIWSGSPSTNSLAEGFESLHTDNSINMNIFLKATLVLKVTLGML